MNKWKKTILPAALAMALVVPAAAYAADQAANSTTPPAQNPADAGSLFKHHKRGEFGPKLQERREDAKINQNKYMQLMFEKYVPNSLTDWKTASAERDRLIEQFKQLMQDDKYKNVVKEEAKAKRQELKDAWKKEQDALKQKLKNGEITKDQMKEQVKNHAKSLEGLKGKAFIGKDILQPEQKALAEHRKELTDAIKADDTEAIRTALSKLLDDLKKSNQELSAKIDQIKQKAASADASQS